MAGRDFLPFAELFETPLRNGLTKPKAVRGEGMKMVNMGEVFAHRRIHNLDMDRVPMDSKERDSSLLRSGDLLFARQSLVLSGAGKCVLFQGDKEDVTFESHIIRCRLDQRKAEPAFYFYLFQSSQGRSLIESIVEQVAAAGIRGSDLGRLAVPVPPLAEQKAIAAVLGALDDKIELNRRMNATLEGIARALFQSWFVDFNPVRANMDRRGQKSELGKVKSEKDQPSDISNFTFQSSLFLSPATAALFPEHLEDSPLGHIPKGWEVCSLANKIELLSGGTPKTSEPDYWDGDIPWYSVKDAPSETDVWVIQTEKQVTKLGIENSAAQVLPEGTTIISARGTVGKLALAGTPMAMNQSCYGVRGAKGYADYFTYFALRQATADLQQRTHGTVFDTITRQTFETLDCIFPPAPLTQAFDRTVAPLLVQIRANLHQSRTLATLRDTLLPKLLSGEMSVTKFEN